VAYLLSEILDERHIMPELVRQKLREVYALTRAVIEEYEVTMKAQRQKRRNIAALYVEVSQHSG
jgi:hypothetical protein